ncbi:MAG TPA: DUF1264 domain-containing protein [Trichormus sp.]|jgi:hypothetical protein
MKKQLITTLLAVSSVAFLAGVPVRAESDQHSSHAAGMAGCTQDLTPPKQIEMYLDGFHCIKNEMNLPAEKQLQIRAAHYCAHHGNIFMCSVYDGTGPDARLVAVEYVIGNDVYQKLSPQEKKYWHPHDAEVDTGLLRMPGLDADKEKATLAFLHSTWGKTWQVWPDLSKDLPVGEPVLLWSIEPSKINASTKTAKDKRDAAMAKPADAAKTSSATNTSDVVKTSETVKQ